MKHCACLIFGPLFFAMPAASYAFLQPVGADRAMVQSSPVEMLADLLVSPDGLIQSLLNDFEWEVRKKVGEGNDVSPEMTYPGITEAIVRATRNETELILEENLPALRHFVLSLLKKELTLDEVSQAYNFYSSPTGRKLSRAAINGATGSELDEIVQAGTIAALQAMGPEDTDALTRFGNSAVYPKLAALRPKLRQGTSDWVAEVLSREQGRVSQVFLDAIAAHIADLQQKVSE
ncbi:DUF2059 domain-containing protein [Blastomonas sp. AAP25]|uniref:DUF2059 domain-containing protein n=1 Tax=Blastomonas sp. AAP25 TaxID=1523416 RepID=UPI000AD1A7C6|nr:DUF2059 domain-containing protein [Blastomonas sp. AAP25]